MANFTPNAILSLFSSSSLSVSLAIINSYWFCFLPFFTFVLFTVSTFQVEQSTCHRITGEHTFYFWFLQLWKQSVTFIWVKEKEWEEVNEQNELSCRMMNDLLWESPKRTHCCADDDGKEASWKDLHFATRCELIQLKCSQVKNVTQFALDCVCVWVCMHVCIYFGSSHWKKQNKGIKSMKKQSTLKLADGEAVRGFSLSFFLSFYSQFTRLELETVANDEHFTFFLILSLSSRALLFLFHHLFSLKKQEAALR